MLFPMRLLLASALLSVLATSLQAAPPNVLFIAVDDLRPELNCYGESKIHSPNIDRLASTGVRFDRAYCMVPTCGASRASMMTGIRPAPRRFVNYLAWAEKDAPGATTLNQFFHDNGYYTLSLGKVFHHPTDSEDGWSEPAWRPRNVARYRDPRSLEILEQARKEDRRGPAWESADVPDDAYADGVLAARAVDELQRLNDLDQPFFLAVGFFKPHLPFVAPTRYWDLYEEDEVQLPENYHVPLDAPAVSIHNSGELRKYARIPGKGLLPDEMARQLIHGYYACVSYTDAQIGKLLDQLDRLELSDNTIVVLWGDHGWNLGEHTLWCKHSCYETSMRIPLIVRAPGIDAGKSTSGLTESIDIYPSLCELTGFEAPSHLQGRSFVSLLHQPDQDWSEAAVGRYRSGDTIRTDRYRYTEYGAKDGEIAARMLYDHRVDPGENRNVVDSEKNDSAISKLSEQLQQQMGRQGDVPSQ